MASRELLWIDIVGEVASLQRREVMACRRREDPVALAGRRFDTRNGRGEIGHDDCAGELASRVASDAIQHLAISQVNVPVVGPADGDGLQSHAGSLAKRHGLYHPHGSRPRQIVG